MGSVSYQHGDITSIRGVDAICHQVNCLTVKAHGLSSQIAKKYPWADIYAKRKSIGNRNLATVETRGTPGDVAIYGDNSGFHVVCLLAQWEYGKCFRSRREEISPYKDTPEKRSEWFKECLDKLGKRDDIQTIAFPENIGCGLAGGNWKIYLEHIKNFAKDYNKTVLIIKYDN
ncbi:uncharacterized protein LOC123540143 [Mercenaria mercenaria]|uniref:uncharacterized protein LOC123540143 n=1 Tax=Mercenaria mercenaria TaxID=6596 RepID=UPI001E1DF95A|nr:uncharacterized protein LOC123540143 [Mercenaria mercenaria]